MSTSFLSKTAAGLVKDYKLNPEEFPEMLGFISKNTSFYFISRTFRAPTHADYLPLSKIEDLFTNRIPMLIDLIEAYLKKGQQLQSRKNIANENNVFLQ